MNGVMSGKEHPVNSRLQRAKSIAAGLAVGLLAGSPALADDTELLLLNPSAAERPTPNILFILDTSGSMTSTEMTTLPYDSGRPYTGTCDPNRVYWTDIDLIPECATTDFSISDDRFECEAADDPFAGVGSYTDTMIQYRDGGSDGSSRGARTWQTLSAGYNEPVECLADSGIHGDGRKEHKWAKSGGDLKDSFTNTASEEVAWGSSPRNLSYTVYSGNYLNWRQNPEIGELSRAEIMQTVVKQILSTYDNLNVGLMRFNDEDGGVVSVAIKDLQDNRAEILDTIDTFAPETYTPIAETLYEASLYWRGLPSHYADSVFEHPTDSEALAFEVPRVYQAPPIDACSKNYNVILSDSGPNRDFDVPGLISNLPNFQTTACTVSGEGACLEDLAVYLSSVDISSSKEGDQLVTTYTIGFAEDVDRLEDTAVLSGGEYYTADDIESLTKTLTTILGNITDRTLSFTAPAVAANSFNRTQNLNDLYVGQFGVEGKARWPGNLKKYRITDRQITGANDVPAIDPTTGYFKDTVASFWSTERDGNNVRRGGAASKLPNPDQRNIYTNNSGADLTLPANAVDVDNLSSFSDSDFGLSGALGEPSKENIVRWVRGEDVQDVIPDSTVRYEMGDPLHSQPAAVIYGGTESNPDVVVYLATNDGNLHAIDGSSGVERWSFIPKDLLSNLTRLYVNPASKYKQYGLDGNIVPAVKDVDGDGIIEKSDGDYVHLIFGMRRGGNNLYALDVTDKDRPEMLWKRSYPEFGETWSAPVVSRMDIASTTQNSDKAVLVLGGGYDTVHDTPAHPSDADGNGAGIHILDLKSGDELWRTGRDSSADLRLARMTRSIPTSVRVVDLTGDGFADRMYASDMGGRIWRFDVFNGETPSSLVTGGVIAELGADGSTSVDPANTRRFYNSPDVSIFLDKVQQRRFIALSIGSGYRSHPFDLSAQDQFYSIRDRDVFNKLPQSTYATYSKVKESDLVEVSGKTGVIVSSSQRGWKFTLPDNQKILADSLTFDDQILFVAFSPDSDAAVNCDTGQGSNYLYRMAVSNGDPIVNNVTAIVPELSDDARRESLKQVGIAPSPTLLFPSPNNLLCGNNIDCSPAPLACVGAECFDAGFENNPVRTLWTQDGIE